MSREGIETVLRTLAEHASFAAQLGSDASLLNGYDVTPEEQQLLRNHDVDRLRALGVSEELLDHVANVPRL